MSVFAIGDLHLCLSAQDKTMDVFRGWDNYIERIEQGWRANICPDDVVVIAGDVSWALRLEDSAADFEFIESLPGRKLLVKGNHDYWWSTRSKSETYFASLGLKSLSILHNNAVQVGDSWLCGSRGWLFENGAAHDRKIVEREACRISASLSSAPPDADKILFLHYPPLLGSQVNEEFFDLMEQHGVKRCYYGHLHGNSIHAATVTNYRGVSLGLISADALGFTPIKIL